MNLPLLPSKEVIAGRLPLIFPLGITNRNYLVRDLSASTIYVMLYVGAIADRNIFCSPKHIYKMTEEQSHLVEQEDRIQYYKCILTSKCQIAGKRWYQDTTREPIRDETLRFGLVEIGAAIENTSIPKTSSKPRYTLQESFASLFDPNLEGETLQKAIANWQEQNISKNALTRLKIARRTENDDNILITFPNRETRALSAGPSSDISKHVIERFANTFLDAPFVLWLSESGNKVVSRDDLLAKELDIEIDASNNLPDIILVDNVNPPLLVFIEVVATDGAITAGRKKALFAITDKAGFDRSQVLFVSAFLDRQSVGFKKTITDIDWNSLLWFASEPDNLFILKEGSIKLSDIVKNVYK